MPKEEQEWGVVLTDTGLNELEGEIELYVCEESQKQFLLCKQVDIGHMYLRVVVEYRDPDDSLCEFEMSIPHGYVKFIVTATDRQKIGFLLNKKRPA